jgi:hypothetical protein
LQKKKKIEKPVPAGTSVVLPNGELATRHKAACCAVTFENEKQGKFIIEINLDSAGYGKFKSFND